MIFHSRAVNYRVQLVPGGYRNDPTRPDTLLPVVGDVAEFKGGVFDTEKYTGSLSQEAVIKRLKSLPGYGYKKDVWAREDIPEQVRMEDEVKKLRRKVEEYERMTGREVTVIMPETPKAEPEKVEQSDNPLVYLARMRNEAKARGIKAERTWGIPEFEAALAAHKEE